ncbi:hypothetical protein GCM10009760_44160 [Kitasatospora kazusensis]|uniref:WD40 repeat protein n=1 Tax=Kitasatospora kazusensis TaxID=407974 RepID=A0ABN2ZYH8_9ACTN
MHVVLPAPGMTVRAALWTLAHRLGVAARTPAELLTAMAESGGRTVICVPGLDRAADPGRLVGELLNPLLRLSQVRLVVEAPDGSPEALGLTAVPEAAVLDLDHPQWTDRARFEAWCAAVGADAAAYPSPGRALGVAGRPEPRGVAELAALVPRTPDGTPDPAGAGEQLLAELWTATGREGGTAQLLADPTLLTYAGPVAVTAALEGQAGPVAAAWDAAGPALVAEPDPAIRAAVLRTRLIGLDDAAVARLGTVAAPWRAAWGLWPDSSVGWPGPVAALAVGAGRYAGQLLLADPGGTIRTVDAATGTPVAGVELPSPKPLRGVTVTQDGHLVLLDAWGGLELLPAEGTDAAQAQTAAAALQGAAGADLSVLHAVGGLPAEAPAVADEAGRVYWRQGGQVLAERLHQGPVTALGGAVRGGRAVLASGGLDGAVRLWSPGAAPVAEPLDRRDPLVSAVAAAETPAGLLVAAAWADGLTRLRLVGSPEPLLELRLGTQVWALTLAPGRVVLGTADGVAAVDFGA